MSTQSKETADTTETHGRNETVRRPRPKRVISSAGRRVGNGVTASLVGGTLLAAAVRAAGRNRRRAGLFGLVGAALLGVGIGRRRSDDGTSGPDGRARKSSAEASAHRTASDLVDRSETNPRGVGDSDVATEPNEGSVQFTTEQDETGEPRPHLDPDDPGDPRYADEDDPETNGDHVEVSLSSTKTTDELGKVAAPDEEQAYPASEGTDPEPMSEKAPPRYGEGAAVNEGEHGEESPAGDESQVSEDESENDEETT